MSSLSWIREQQEHMQVFHVVNLQMRQVKMKMTAVKWDLVVKAIAKIKCKNQKLKYM